MMTYRRAAEEQRSNRRSAQDALEVLRSEAGFCGDDRATFRVAGLKLPSGNKVGLIQLEFDDRVSGNVVTVDLPTASHFSAIRRGETSSDTFEIWALDGVHITNDGLAILQDGVEVRAINVEPAVLPQEPSWIDWCVVHLTLELVDPEKRCFRSLRNCLKPEHAEAVPDEHDRYLDCSRLSGLAIPPLKVIKAHMSEQDSRFKKLSLEQIAEKPQQVRHPYTACTSPEVSAAQYRHNLTCIAIAASG